MTATQTDSSEPPMNVSIQLELGTRLTLQEAWLIYTNPLNNEVGDVRCCQVVPDHEGGLRLGVGHPLSQGGLEAALEGLAKSTFSLSHPSLLAGDGRRMVFYCAPGPRRLHFSSADPALGALSGDSFPQPALLFDVSGRRVRVAALKGRSRPTPETRLYRAPYFNVFADDRVCWGSTPYPRGVNSSEPLEWAEAFFSSSFTHPSSPLPTSRFGGTHAQLWQAAQKEGHFKAVWLSPLVRTPGTKRKKSTPPPPLTLKEWLLEGK